MTQAKLVPQKLIGLQQNEHWDYWDIFNSRMSRYLIGITYIQISMTYKILESQPVHTKLRKKLANTTYLWKFFPQLRCYFGSFSTTLQSNWPFETKLLASSCIVYTHVFCRMLLWLLLGVGRSLWALVYTRSGISNERKIFPTHSPVHNPSNVNAGMICFFLQ